MIKTLIDIQRQERKLIEKHPTLAELKGVSAREIFFGPYRFITLAKFIDRSWRDTYQGHSRMDYSAGYLNWAYGIDGVDSDMSMVLTDKYRTIIGLFLFTHRSFYAWGKIFNTGICSALSISPEAKSSGAAKLIHLKVQEKSAGKIDGVFYWYDSSIKIPMSSHTIFSNLEKSFFTHQGKYSLNARIFSTQRAMKNHRFKFYERPLVKMFSGPPKVNRRVVHGIIDENNVEEATAYLNSIALSNGMGRNYAPEELLRYANFKDGNFQAIGWYLRHRGVMSGVAVGYTIDSIGKNRDRIFFLDLLVVTKGSYLESFLCAVEEDVIDVTKSFCVLSPLPNLGIKQKYIPSGSHITCYSLAYDNNFRLSGKGSKQIIIDHK